MLNSDPRMGWLDGEGWWKKDGVAAWGQWLFLGIFIGFMIGVFVMAWT